MIILHLPFHALFFLTSEPGISFGHLSRGTAERHLKEILTKENWKVLLWPSGKNIVLFQYLWRKRSNCIAERQVDFGFFVSILHHHTDIRLLAGSLSVPFSFLHLVENLRNIIIVVIIAVVIIINPHHMFFLFSATWSIEQLFHLFDIHSTIHINGSSILVSSRDFLLCFIKIPERFILSPTILSSSMNGCSAQFVFNSCHLRFFRWCLRCTLISSFYSPP